MTKKERARLRRQRKIRRTILSIAMVALVAVFSIGGTIAWLSDKSDEVKNVFTASDIDIELKETKSDFKMVPGNKIAKDPKVTVKADSEACWLFVEVTESSDPKLSDYIDYSIASGWNQGTGEEGDIPANVYYRTVDATTSDTAFQILAGEGEGEYKDGKVQVKSDVTKDMMTAIAGEESKPTLTFTAYACQSDNVKTAADAWSIASSSSGT